MKGLKKITGLIVVLFCSLFVFGQTGAQRYIEDIELRIDTLVYSWNKDNVLINNERHLAFLYTSNNPSVEVRFYLKKVGGEAAKITKLLPSENYRITDSIRWINDRYYRVKIRFDDLANASFTSLLPEVLSENGTASTLSLPLFPHTNTFATINASDQDLFIGEEKTFEVITNRPENIKVDPRWKKGPAYDYRLFRQDDKLLFTVIPHQIGQIKVNTQFELYKPFLSEQNKPRYQLPEETIVFTVKGSRLSFLRFDEREIIWERDNKEGIELQIDNHRLLQLNKTYRIEATDEPGGPLIAELFTVRRLSNDKVLCMFRPYNFHRTSDSYLFIKDGDDPQFITNINIFPEPKIKRVSMLRRGGTWVNSSNIYPGETVEIRLEGESLDRGEFVFQGLTDVSADTIIRNESVVHYLLHVPMDIRQKSVSIYSRGRKTGVNLDVQEYLRPRELDFVIVEYGSAPKIVSRVTQPLLHRGTIGDINIQFDPLFIDEERNLYGKQYLEIEVRIKDHRNVLLERYVIDDIEVCPGESSPRYFSYTNGGNGCLNETVSINDYISNKTHSLTNWSKVELIIRHRKGYYEGRGYTERIEIIKEKLVTFDVDLTIPAGLLIKKIGVDGFPNLSGVSLSMLGQFSFYQKGEIQRLRPYKIGAGFLAKNAFNFNPEADRDLGIVILGSVYPTRKETKFSFPLYAGFGYFLNESRFFYLIGPGIRINL